MLKSISKSLVMTVGLTLGLVQSAQAATFNITSFDDGWYSQDGGHSPTNANNITGDNGTSDYNSFFAFNLSQLSGMNVVAVTINFIADGRYVSAETSETLGLFDVSTAINSLVTGVGGTAAYSDLGSGTSYGSYVYTEPNANDVTGIPMDPFSVVLNAAAIADMNGVLSGSDNRFAIGATLLSLDNDPSSYETLWSSSERNPGTATLTIETGVAPVPLPASSLLLVAGLLGLGAIGRRART